MATAPDVDVRGAGRDKRMSLGDHLREFRRRLLISCAALVVAMVIAFFVTEPVIQWITIPIDIVRSMRDGAETNLMVTTVTQPFDLRMKIAFAIGLFLSAPVWIWQIWAFVMPAMTKKEIRYTVGFVAAAVPLFFGGCVVAWWIMPHIIELMATFIPGNTVANYSATEYYDFVFKLMLIVGVAFILPVFLVALNFAGVMSGRAILKGWRIAILVAVIFAAITTPAADVGSMLLLGGILIVLYFAAAGVSLLFDRRRRKRAAALLPEAAL